MRIYRTEVMAGGEADSLNQVLYINQAAVEKLRVSTLWIGSFHHTSGGKHHLTAAKMITHSGLKL